MEGWAQAWVVGTKAVVEVLSSADLVQKRIEHVVWVHHIHGALDQVQVKKV